MVANHDPLPMRWCCLQHVPFEGPSHLATWCQKRGFPLTRIELWSNRALPAPNEFDGLFVLGGPMNVYDDTKYPWLRREKELIARAVSDRKTIVGVCLGAQQLSVVLGGSVTEMVDKEIGWFPVELTRSGRDASLFRGLPGQFMAFHWHGDSFSIPPQAIHVARSDACDEQAFIYENHVIGLQFHLESSEQAIAGWFEHCGKDTGRGHCVQDSHDIASFAHYVPETHSLLAKLLENLTEVNSNNSNATL